MFYTYSHRKNFSENKVPAEYDQHASFQPLFSSRLFFCMLLLPLQTGLIVAVDPFIQCSPLPANE